MKKKLAAMVTTAVLLSAGPLAGAAQAAPTALANKPTGVWCWFFPDRCK